MIIVCCGFYNPIKRKRALFFLIHKREIIGLFWAD